MTAHSPTPLDDAAEARRLRAQEGLSTSQIQRRLGISRHLVRQWVHGIPAPAWTRRPNAKDALRAQAEQLRQLGWSVPEIAVELGVARSTAFRWTQHIPLQPDTERARARREHSKRMTDAQWASHRAQRQAQRHAAHAAVAATIGHLTVRELMLIGAVAYWCEGAKTRPWRPEERVIFTNSDPVLVELFLRFLEGVGVARSGLKYRLSIHESADADRSMRWWAGHLRVPDESFQRPTLKRHRSGARRHNTGADYHGCLVVTVPRGRELYWRIEGIMQGVAGAIGMQSLR